MSAETIPRNTDKKISASDAEQLKLLVHGPSEETPYENNDTENTTSVEVTSETSSEFNVTVETRMSRLKRRVSDFLNDRVIEPLHNQADQADAFASYADNIQYSKMNDRYDRNEKVKATLKNIGTVALGYGVIGADKVAHGVETVATEVKDAAQVGVEDLKDGALRTLDTAYFATKDVVNGAKDFVGDKIDTTKDKVASVKDRILEKYAAAQTRKAARVARRHASFEAKKDKVSELWQSAHAKRRALGGRALGAYRSAQGNIAGSIASAHAAGTAARDAWTDTRNSL